MKRNQFNSIFAFNAQNWKSWLISPTLEYKDAQIILQSLMPNMSFRYFIIIVNIYMNIGQDKLILYSSLQILQF
jgi:hypothetical protein